MCFRAIDVDVRTEDASSHGRADMVVLTGGQVFVLEFKMADGDGDAAAALDAAITQMREQGYADKYRGRGEPVHLIGVVCGREAQETSWRSGSSPPGSIMASGLFPTWAGRTGFGVHSSVNDVLARRLPADSSLDIPGSNTTTEN